MEHQVLYHVHKRPLTYLCPEPYQSGTQLVCYSFYISFNSILPSKPRSTEWLCLFMCFGLKLRSNVARSELHNFYHVHIFTADLNLKFQLRTFITMPECCCSCAPLQLSNYVILQVYNPILHLSFGSQRSVRKRI